ncbi:head GIN domain-containing protein [Undibacterium sp. Ji50W]|uniref:head GIN domain-containing protein n=1 Tax=Undibacterium sp. Ji50W TaxID=3413041 RepID=UPI003BF2BCF3
MKNIIRTGAGMLALSVILTGASVVFIKAHAANVATASGGSAASEARPVNATVVNVVMHGPVDLILKQASTPEMLIRGDAKLVSRITTTIEGNTLHIGTRGIYISIGKTEQTKVELSLPNLEKLQLSGSGDASIKGFRGNKMDISVNGSGDVNFDGDFQQVNAGLHGSGNLNLNLGNSDTVELSVNGSGDSVIKGQSKVLNARLNGSGDLNAVSLKSAQVFINSVGSSSARVFASQEARLKLTGSGDVHVFGNPGKRNVERAGSGEVRWD